MTSYRTRVLLDVECPLCKGRIQLTLGGAEEQEHPPQPQVNREQLAEQLSKYANDITVSRQPDGAKVVKPTHFLGDQRFKEISAIIKQLGGTYKSAGKDSCWVVPA